MAINLQGTNESTFSNDVTTAGDLSANSADIGSGNISLNADGVISSSNSNNIWIEREWTGDPANSAAYTAFRVLNNGANTWKVSCDGTTFIGGADINTPNIRLNANGDIKLGRNCEFWTGTTPNGAVLFDTGASGGAGATVVRCFGTNGTGGGGVELVRNATSWGAYSQRSLKTDFAPIASGLEKVSTLSAVTGRYKTDEVGTSRSFLIADEVQAVLPEAVSGAGTEEDPLILRYTEVIPLLVSALHDAKDRIETLEAKVQQLEGGTN